MCWGIHHSLQNPIQWLFKTGYPVTVNRIRAPANEDGTCRHSTTRLFTLVRVQSKGTNLCCGQQEKHPPGRFRNGLDYRKSPLATHRELCRRLTPLFYPPEPCPCFQQPGSGLHRPQEPVRSLKFGAHHSLPTRISHGALGAPDDTALKPCPCVQIVSSRVWTEVRAPPEEIRERSPRRGSST